MKPNWLILAFLIGTSACTAPETNLTLAVTTDVHGMIYPIDYISRIPASHSLAHVHSYAEKQRDRKDTLFFLLDNGDFLQGQPGVYYYNFIDTISPHLSARVMNYMGYKAGTIGNHDIETGPAVYNKFRSELKFPWLAANAIHSQSGEPYFTPYTMLQAGKKRIAIFGMVTPGIPQWLPKILWPEMEFQDMVECARKWIPVIREKENPDIMVGLFHSGTDAGYGEDPGPYLNENAVLLVAENVPGFDVIYAGHDHRVSLQWIRNINGDSVMVIDPGSHGRYVGEVNISMDGEGNKVISGRNIAMKDLEPSAEFLEEFAAERKQIEKYLNDTVTWLTKELRAAEGLFGPSPLMNLIHHVQLELSGAEVSFTAPLSLLAYLKPGPLLVSDMFKLYRFENMLYSMNLTGAEIDSFLEYAAGFWYNKMTKPGEPLLQFKKGEPGRLANPYYNFSSAAGINYTVDISKEAGDRITVTGLSDGREFTMTDTFSVAINSYRGNGGGGHLTRGAGIPKEKLSERISWSTDKDLRYYLLNYLEHQDTLEIPLYSNWLCIPSDLARDGMLRDREYFF